MFMESGSAQASWSVFRGTRPDEREPNICHDAVSLKRVTDDLIKLLTSGREHGQPLSLDLVGRAAVVEPPGQSQDSRFNILDGLFTLAAQRNESS